MLIALKRTFFVVNRNGSSIEGMESLPPPRGTLRDRWDMVLTPRVEPLVINHYAGGTTGFEVRQR